MVPLAQALAEAFAHLDGGRLPEARRLVRHIERVYPSAPGLPYLQGLIALAAGEGRKAAQHLAKSLTQTPDAPPPLLAMAAAQALQKRYGPAEAVYGRLIVLFPEMAEAYGELGARHLAAGHMDAAVRLLDHAVTLRPDWGRAWNHLGVAQRTLGLWDAAALSFARAVDIEKTPAKALANLAGVLRRLKRFSDSVSLAARAVSLEPDEASHWLELGQAERDAGNLADAVSAFAEASRRDADALDALWLEAECLVGLARRDEARAAYRRLLAQDPADRFGAALALAQLDALPPPKEAPAAFVRTLFDQYADGFDRDLVAGLNYRGPAVLSDAIGRTLGRGPFTVFDVGCGTGLMGIALRPVADRLDGVDLSPRMVAKASDRGLYDDLCAGDLVAALAARPATYDLVVAADVLIYLGDLRPVFAAAAKALRPGGGFAFTVEAHAGEGYVLQESRRFAHGLSYLRQQAAEAGFVPMLLEEVSIRDDRSQPVPGFVVVLRRLVPKGS
jgi:predicted TPR repeat methyltransferase